MKVFVKNVRLDCHEGVCEGVCEEYQVILP